MTGPEHYREAERRLMAVTKKSEYGGTVVAGDANPNVIAVAQVHATLALAAAVALAGITLPLPANHDLATDWNTTIAPEATP